MSSSKKTFQLVALLLSFLLVSTAGGVLASGLALPVVTALGATTSAATDVFNETPGELGTEEMSEQSVLQARDGTVIARFFIHNRITVPMEQIDPIMGQAVVAVEDHRFYEHSGVDPEGLMRALVGQLTGSSSAGGSTITQQYVKNVRVEAGRNANDPDAVADATAYSIGRKLEEAKVAIQLEKTRSKEEILEGYLNLAQFGPSQWGVETASRYYFSHSADELTPAEAALLAGITQAPNRWDPERDPDAAKTRRDTVLYTMLREEVITQEEYDAAVATPIEDMLRINPTPSGCAAAADAAYFCDYVQTIIASDPVFGETSEERQNLLFRGGLTIRTTLDLNLQRAARESLVERIPVGDPSEISNAMSVVEPGTGEILAMAQNTNYGEPTEDEPYRTQVNYNVDQQHNGGSGFQTGSSYKAIILAAWLEQGKSLNDTVNSRNSQNFPRGSFDYGACGLQAYDDDWPVGNLEGAGFTDLTVLRATAESTNTSFGHMAAEIGICPIIDMAQKLGLHDASGATFQGPEGSGEELVVNPNPASILGTNTFSPLVMASAFATFAAEGTRCDPVAILEVLDPDGEAIPIPAGQCEQVISPEVANTTTYALTNAVNTGTGRNAQLPDRPAAGKTGTTNGQAAAWFVGYIPQMAAAVWTGYSSAGSRSMQASQIGGQYYPHVGGGIISAPVWGEFMKRATVDLPVQQFPEPNERLLHGERVTVPDVINVMVDQAQTHLEGLGFTVRIGQTQSADHAAVGAVAATQPVAGSRVRPGSTITIFPSSGPAPEPEPEPTENEGGPPPDDDD